MVLSASLQLIAIHVVLLFDNIDAFVVCVCVCVCVSSSVYCISFFFLCVCIPNNDVFLHVLKSYIAQHSIDAVNIDVLGHVYCNMI